MSGPYTAVRMEGGLLAADLIERIAAGDPDLAGSRPEDYHLAAGERLGDAASREWNYLGAAYRAFGNRLASLAEGDPATSLTRERWLLVLLRQLGFGQVPFVRGDLSVDGRQFRISHLWQQVPMLLLGWRTDLDHRSGSGPAGRAPQSLMQDFLNASDQHLWGLLSNGRQLRILRDSSALTGAAYVEFDLETIFGGDLYSDFVLLYALAHQSRFEAQATDDQPPSPGRCWLERWRAHAIETGTRARDQLRDGVERALGELGTGFLAANPRLREQLADGELTLSDFRHELLRLVYQLVFLFVAEDRGGLHDPGSSAEARERYQRYFSTARLRRIARVRRGDAHSDLWRTLVVVLDGLGSDAGRREVGLPGLGGLYFRGGRANGDGQLMPDLLRDCQLGNDCLLAAVRLLDEVADRRGRRQRVDYRHLGAEELGSIYESLLELIPRHDPASGRFWLEQVRGHDRKSTGSYYTPTPLIETLLDSTLEPAIEQAAASGNPDDLLRIRVCDPACGSGHFLVAAARRISRRYAALAFGDDEPPPHLVTQAMRKVVGRCIYGVDINPLAAELAKVSLWLESLEPGRPLAFLDPHVKIGNSLLGATPALIEAGIPAAAYEVLPGDDKRIVASLKRKNAAELEGQQNLFDDPPVLAGNSEVARAAEQVAATPVRSLADVREQARRFRELERSPELERLREVANAWCAAFVWPKHEGAPEPPTTDVLRRLDADRSSLPSDVAAELALLASRYRFFHWHLEFPEVFRVEGEDQPDHEPATGWKGGFSCVIGNPPWERVKLQEQEFFAARRPEIADAPNAAARKRMIEQLAESEAPEDRRLSAELALELRRAAGVSHLLRESGRYPLAGRGDVNTYAVFAELAGSLLEPEGRSGLVLPTGIATDATTAHFFGDLVRGSRLVSFLEFENEEFLLSRAVDHRVRFGLLSACGRSATVEQASFAFGVRRMADLPERTFTLTRDDLLLVNPNTGTVPLFRSRRDAEITLGMYRRVPVLWREEPEENPWGVSFMAMFHMANDSRLFRTREQLEAEGWGLEGKVFVKDGRRMLPLYEAKMVGQFDHRFGTYEGQTEAQANMGTLPRPTLEQKENPGFAVVPRYWVQEFDTLNEQRSKPGKPVYDVGVGGRLQGKDWNLEWLLGWRDFARSSDARTVIASAVPRVAVGDTYLLGLAPSRGWMLPANLSAFILDYSARQKSAGTHLKYFLVKQLPVLPPATYDQPTPWASAHSLADWIEPRVLELSYTAWDMRGFARDLGDSGPPFVWDEDRRFAIRVELDAAYFHLYGVKRDDVSYVMDTFGAFRRNDPELFARTRALILERYDAMAAAMQSGSSYPTIVEPPPGCGRRHS